MPPHPPGQVFPKDYARALAEAAATKEAEAAEAPLALTSGDAFEQLKAMAAAATVSNPPKAASLEGLMNGSFKSKSDKHNLNRMALEGLPVKGVPATWEADRPSVLKEAPANKVRGFAGMDSRPVDQLWAQLTPASPLPLLCKSP